MQMTDQQLKLVLSSIAVSELAYISGTPVVACADPRANETLKALIEWCRNNFKRGEHVNINTYALQSEILAMLVNNVNDFDIVHVAGKYRVICGLKEDIQYDLGIIYKDMLYAFRFMSAEKFERAKTKLTGAYNGFPQCCVDNVGKEKIEISKALPFPFNGSNYRPCGTCVKLSPQTILKRIRERRVARTEFDQRDYRRRQKIDQIDIINYYLKHTQDFMVQMYKNTSLSRNM